MAPSLTIVLLGNTGVGKSASGNTILGGKAFKSERSFNSITTEISRKSGQVFGKTIEVIDTPGILDPVEAVKQIETLCHSLCKEDSSRLFLVVVKIDRFTGEQKVAVEKTLSIIGEEEMKNSYMLFTCGDYLHDKLEDFIYKEPNGHLVQLVDRFAGIHLFNNENGGQEQVRQLLLKSGHLDSHVQVVERTIILLGLPGDGKSASGNTIVGSDRFTSGGGFAAVTKECASKSTRVGGRNVTVVDTPGFSQKVLAPKQLYNEIVKAVQEANPGPHAFVIVVRIGRFSEANIILFEMLPRIFGKNSVNYTMILFTYGDQLGDQSIGDLIETQESLSKLVKMCGQRYCVFNNSQKANRQQVEVLLAKVDEMVAANAGADRFTAQMFYDVQSPTLKMSVKLEEFFQWFQQKLKMLDCCHSGYEEID